MNLYGHVVKSLTDSDDEDAWIIEGLASSPGLDLQGDIIPPEAFDLQYFLGKKLLDKSVTKHRVKKPWVDWNHGFELAEEDDPDLIAGEPIDAKVTPEGLMVRLKLYKNHLGSEIRRNMEQFTKFGWPRRYGLSVSGLAQRDPNNLARIKRFIATSVAITPRPVNPETWAEIAKAATIRDSLTTTHRLYMRAFAFRLLLLPRPYCIKPIVVPTTFVVVIKLLSMLRVLSILSIRHFVPPVKPGLHGKSVIALTSGRIPPWTPPFIHPANFVHQLQR